MTRRRSVAARIAFVMSTLCASVLPFATGCSTPTTRTSFLRSVDLVEMTDSMSMKLAGDPVIQSRTPADDPWVISLNRVANKTNQIIRDGEKWLYVGRLRAMLAQSGIADDHALIWVIPPEQWERIRGEVGDLDGKPIDRRAPTHQLTAEFFSLTNTEASSGRSDTYLCSYQLLDLVTGSIVWEDSWEVKRVTSGRTFD